MKRGQSRGQTVAVGGRNQHPSFAPPKPRKPPKPRWHKLAPTVRVPTPGRKLPSFAPYCARCGIHRTQRLLKRCHDDFRDTQYIDSNGTIRRYYHNWRVIR